MMVRPARILNGAAVEVNRVLGRLSDCGCGRYGCHAGAIDVGPVGAKVGIEDR